MKNKRGFSLFSTAIVFIVAMVIMVLAAHQQGIDTSTVDKAIETLDWNKYQTNFSISLNKSMQNQPGYIVTILRIVEKGVDFAGYSIMAVAKLSMETARDNPDIINFKTLLVLLCIFLVAPLIWPTFIITVSLILIIREWLALRKEKKALIKHES